MLMKGSTSLQTKIQIVWFKRDLRVKDHAALSSASERGPVVGLYIFEPELVASPEFDRSHFDFIRESLVELRTNLRKIGSDLLVFHGEAVSCFQKLWDALPFESLWSHEETGNDLTFKRDLKVKDWCKRKSIPWREPRQFGVVRHLKSRAQWAGSWEEHMTSDVLAVPKMTTTLKPELKKLVDPWNNIPGDDQILSHGFSKPEAMLAGEARAHEVLNSFLNSRGLTYSFGMSSPVTGFGACSRLSPHLTWGNISIREVYQCTRARVAELRDQQAFGMPVDRQWFRSLSAFESRLRWHCHFIQKLETEPAIEFENVMRAFNGMRETQFNDGYFNSWCLGQTGYPMIDACMRALHRGGWINFRMRAMLVSFASYQLWLHWRKPAMFLARHFLDYEPGIHFSQVQMQSGTTGINAIRIYSPIKQVFDQDPDGRFIRHYVPELELVPNEFLAEPHKMPLNLQKERNCIIGNHYPEPIVEHTAAFKLARQRYGDFKRSVASLVKSEKPRILRRHTKKAESLQK